MNDDRPKLQVIYEERNVQGRLIADTQLSESVWIRVVQILRDQDPDAVIRDREGRAHWPGVVSALQEIAKLRATYNFEIKPDDEAQERLRQARDERVAVHRAREAGATARFTPDEVREALRRAGFTKRELRPFQVNNLVTLTALEHGANFSVPGSGKTTVSLALHLLIRDAGLHLLVVCPKNAIDAWESVVDECMGAEAAADDVALFVRLEGDVSSIATLLRSGIKRFVITYDKAIRVQGILREYLSTHRVHVILDESHRIKAGEASRRGRVLGYLASLPVRRDILSGTPLPNGLQDIGPQIDFLYPTLGLSRRIEAAGSARDVLRNLYVRTTKRDLELPPRILKFENVEMGRAQLALYTAIKDPVIRDLYKIRNTGRITIAARNNIMRLLEASSNPVLAVNKMGAGAGGGFSPADAICQAVLEEGDSNKILKAVELATNLIAEGKRVVIWALFHDNIDRLTFLLEELGVASLDGRVASGSRDNPDTREGRIAAFHRDDGPKILVANPAACSEGISLHLVCHDAIYLERSYNAGHYLQSIDRIHRLGLSPGTVTNVTVLQSIATKTTGSIDHSVSLRMRAKMRVMNDALEDEDIRQLMIDEEDAPVPILGADFQDFDDLLEQLTLMRLPTDDELAEDD